MKVLRFDQQLGQNTFHTAHTYTRSISFKIPLKQFTRLWDRLSQTHKKAEVYYTPKLCFPISKIFEVFSIEFTRLLCWCHPVSYGFPTVYLALTNEVSHRITIRLAQSPLVKD